MFGYGSLPLRRLGRAATAATRSLLALFFLLALLGAPNPVLCLEGAGSCGGESGADPGFASCHAEFPSSLPDCESCTDVAAPEESLVGAHRPVRSQMFPAALSLPRGIADIPALRSRPSHELSPPSLAQTPTFIRTTVLLI